MRPLTLRVIRIGQFVATGAILLQAGGCDFFRVNEVLQTIFLGITAAGAYAILQNT
jgi:hypothetical protein